MSIENYGKIGFGTFGSDKYDEQEVANAVYLAIRAGYRIFDCASVYGNEKQIGEVFRRAFNEGLVKREDLFIISKVWNDRHGAGEVIESCRQSLHDLGLTYFDLYFVHWPFANFHAKGCSADSRNPDSKPFFVEDFLAVWKQMEFLKKSGEVKEIGMSNMTVPKLEAVLPLCTIPPYAHEMELHPSFQQKELYTYCQRHGIKIIGYCPLGSPNRPERDKTATDIIDTEMEIVQILAKAHQVHPVEVCLKWAAGKGHIPIPFSSRETNIKNNLKAVTENLLTAKEMQAIDAADQNCRLVKGHVFLWDGAKDWTELWDLDGKLADWKFVGQSWRKEK